MPSLTARHYALLAAFTLAIFLPGRASLPPLDRDEPRYMEASAQMLQSGNYIDVRFQDQPRYLQPAGIYWLEAATVAATGTLQHRQVWGWRIPSLVAVVGSSLLTASIGASLFGTEAGLFAALLLAVSVLMTAEGRMATIDSTLLLSILLAEFALLRAWSGRREPRPAPAWVAALYWGALGFGLMLKGPVALIPGFGTPIALALSERDASWWKRLRPAWGVPLMLAIVLPWCIAISLVSHGTFFGKAVGTNFLGKVASGQQAHGLPPGYHLLVFAIAFWPGSLFAACAIPFAWLRRRQDPVRFLLCWIIPHWVVFELVATKLPHYVLPAYPAIAILAAAALVAPEGWSPPRRIAGRLLLAAYGLVWLVVGVGIAAAGPVLLWRLQHVVSPVASFVSVLAIALVLASAWLLWPLRAPRRALGFVAAAALATYASLFIIVLPSLRTIWLSPRIAAMVAEVRPCPDSVLASTSFSEPSLVFLVGPSTRLIGPAPAADLLERDPRCAMALVGSRDAAAFQARLAADGIAARQLGRLDGVNYSTGRHLDLALFKTRQ
ncbi:ArnT family glycosyltransferase [Lichenicoccus sp.]|uniref:ArnT family glycosyltransferase n=1 Tax=Lichenicoccus sp. TaxID=2781899 RepID=UPI003D0DF0CA